MANLFIGFPVPRAKIAEMVEGVAGIGSRYEDPNLFYYTNFESLDGLSNLTAGGASVTLYHIYVLLDTSASTTGSAKLYKGISLAWPAASWDNAFKFRTRARLLTDTDECGEAYIIRGTPGEYQHVGFFIEDGVLKGISRDGSALSTVNLETLATAAFDEERNLECVFTPGVKVEFYVDGIKLGELTTNLPSGTDYANYWFYFYIYCAGHSNRLRLYISQYQLYQAA